MDTKKALWLAGLLIVGLGVALVLGAFAKPTEPVVPGDHTEPTTLIYSNQEFGIAFDYSDQYRLEERTETFEGAALLVLTLVDKDAVVPDMSEGPTAISIIVAENASSTPLEAWVRAKSISNFQLSSDGALASTTFAGNPAVLYRYSGLYENDAVAVSRGDKIFLFSASWIVQDQPIRHDFEHLLESVTFI